MQKPKMIWALNYFATLALFAVKNSPGLAV